MKTRFLTIAFLALAAGCSSQPDAAPAPSTPSASSVARVTTHAEAASASLKTLATLVSPQKSLGFTSPSEVASSTLAEPFAMYHVGLDGLRAYRAGDDPHALFLDTGSFLYPVTVAGVAKSSVVVRKVDGEWKATQFGRPTLAKHVHEGRKSLVAARGVAEAFSYVDIPTMSARMLRHEEKGVAMLTALVDVAGTDIRAGATLPAADVFAKLHPLAVAHDASVPN
jgi:hypothetical protein